MLKIHCVFTHCYGTALFMACHVLADYVHTFTAHVVACLFSVKAYSTYTER
jgi:hypothetical protein